MKRAQFIVLAALTLGFAGVDCSAQPKPPFPKVVLKLTEVAKSAKQWTGFAVGKDDTFFVNFPRWSADVPISVGRINEDGEIEPFPNQAMNSWKPGDIKSAPHKFVCVQAVYIDTKGNLWVLDPASPQMKGVVPGGPKLLQFDHDSGKLLHAYKFDSSIAPEKSYLNDVRFDKGLQHAFLTDSGLGAIVVLDLQSGKARRLLADHASTKSEHTSIVIDKKEWTRNGKRPDIQVDGIAIDNDGKYLYYDALTGKSLYRVPIAALLNEKLAPTELAKQVKKVAEVGPNDGLEFAPDGYLYITGLQEKAIKRWKPETGKTEIVVQSTNLTWPDSLAVGPNNEMFVTTSQINSGDKPKNPYQIFKFKLP